jgi:hypothetical protein
MLGTHFKTRFVRRTVTAIACVVSSVWLLPSAAADALDKKTVFTFSAPVEIPGKVLPAGTYVFKVLDSTGNRNIVQIYDKDEKQVLATLLAIPDYRPDPPDKPIVNFEERPSNSPEALKAWFYPGDNTGWQFAYPHQRAVELAKRTNQNVLSMRDSMTQNMSTKSTSASDASVRELKNTEVQGVDPSGKPVDVIVIVATRPKL